MPRQPRRIVPGVAYHAASRFLDKRYRMVDDVDRKAYLHFTAAAASRSDITIVSFALMSSHVHHGFLAGEDPLARFVQPLHTRFARHWHERHGGLGPVFANRPSTWPAGRDALLRLVAYHHRNPVDAGLVGRPADSDWTSHRYYLRVAPAPPWLDIEKNLALLGFADTDAGRAQFDEFVREVDFADRPWQSDANDSCFVRAPESRCRDVDELLHAYIEKHSVRADQVLRHTRPTHPTRADFVRFAIARGAKTRDLARLLDVDPSTICKLASE